MWPHSYLRPYNSVIHYCPIPTWQSIKCEKGIFIYQISFNSSDITCYLKRCLKGKIWKQKTKHETKQTKQKQPVRLPLINLLWSVYFANPKCFGDHIWWKQGPPAYKCWLSDYMTASTCQATGKMGKGMVAGCLHFEEKPKLCTNKAQMCLLSQFKIHTNILGLQQ